MKRILPLTALSLALVGTALVSGACSEAGPSQLRSGAPQQRGGAATGGDTSATEPADEDTDPPDSSTSGAADSATTGTADAGADGSDAAADASTTAFTGAGAYVATTGPSTIEGAHPNGGNPAKVDCLTAGCHGAGGAGPRFAAGGTVYTSAAATAPAPRVEVRFLDADGTAVSAYTDVNGNFFLRAAAAANLAFPLRVGARDATTTRPMAATIGNGACNSAACHGGAATGVIHVP